MIRTLDGDKMVSEAQENRTSGRSLRSYTESGMLAEVRCPNEILCFKDFHLPGALSLLTSVHATIC